MSKKTKKKLAKKSKKASPKAPAKPQTGRDWSAFNTRIANMRGVEWKKKMMASKAKDTDSLMRIQRISKGYSRPDIAKKLGLRSVTSIERIEKGISAVSPKRAHLIAQMLGTVPGKIFKKVPYKKKYFAIRA